jgi:spermidine synthase
MGIGSWLSRYIGRGLVARFVAVELMVGVVGGFSSMLLFLAFAYTSAFRLTLYATVVVVGVLVGLEVPLLMRILRDRFDFKDVVSNVLTFDYLGALAASLAFPVLLVPHLGSVRSAVLFGLDQRRHRALVDVPLRRRAANASHAEGRVGRGSRVAWRRDGDRGTDHRRG